MRDPCPEWLEELCEAADAGATPELSAHLATCPACAEWLEPLARAARAVALDGYDEPSEGFAERVVAGLPSSAPAPALSALAVLLAGGAGSFAYLGVAAALLLWWRFGSAGIAGALSSAWTHTLSVLGGYQTWVAAPSSMLALAVLGGAAGLCALGALLAHGSWVGLRRVVAAR